MASSQQFNLRWNNHTNNILQVFLEQLTCENLVDVTLSCQGHFLKAHKMILSACSPYFQELFRQHHQVQHPVVILNGMKYNDIKLVVEFMYRGEIKVLETELDGLLDTAETLQVKGLSNVRNKYEKGDIEGAEQLQQPMQVEQEKVNDAASRAPDGMTHLRRKRRKTSPGALNNIADDDDLPATIKVEPPDIRDIDGGEEPNGWESPKLVIDMPEGSGSEQSEDKSTSPQRVNKTTKVGSPSDYGNARYLMEFSSGPGPSQDDTTASNNPTPKQRKQLNQCIRKRPWGKIPRPPNAFMIFANEWRRKLAYQHPTESNKEISVRLGVMWKNLTSDTKEGYYTASRKADEEHKRKYPGYYYSPKEARLRKNLSLMARKNSKKPVEAMHLVKVLMTDGNSHAPYMMVPESHQQLQREFLKKKMQIPRIIRPSSVKRGSRPLPENKDPQTVQIQEDESTVNISEVSPVKSETVEVVEEEQLSPGKPVDKN